MELTPLQLEIQKLGADKSFSFGCLFIMKNKFRKKGLICRVNDEDTYSPIGNSEGGTYSLNHFDISCEDGCKIIKIIGHPITYSRLCYLYWSQKDIKKTEKIGKYFADFNYHFMKNPKLYNQSIFERPEELQLLVRNFLLSIQ